MAYRGQYADAFLDGPVFQDQKDVWQKRLTSPVAGQHTIVAEEDGTLAGFACVFGGEDARWGTLLDNIHVDPQRKREGIGLQLMLEVAAWADRAYPATGFYLWVLEANAPARRFYERLGAHNAEQTTFEPPGGGRVRILRYTWSTPRTLLVAAN
ncbi:MAG: GNAT family N-acetyltransferase [Chloroflexota bacterium]|nr:GNAT family N-acetyltransferase [Chloroflexota bacterium]